MAALQLDGTTGNYASAPDSVPLSITSDITLLVWAALDDWTPAVADALIAKYTTTGNQLSYSLHIQATTGFPVLTLSGDGSTTLTGVADAAPTVSDGASIWVLACWRNSDNRVQFFTAPGTLSDPAASDFTQLGTDKSINLTGIFNSTAVLEVGSRAAGSALNANGKFYRAKIYNGVFSTAAFGGTLAFDAKFMDVVKTGTRTPSSFTESSANAATVTLNGSAWDWYVITGTAASTLSLTATATGTPTVLGTAAASLSLTATAAGTPTVLGTAVSNVALAAAASGLRTIPGVAAASITVTATGTGLRTVSGTGAATVTVTATVTGTGVRPGTATATVTVTATVAGVGGRPGSASAVLALVAAAVGLARQTIFRSPTRPNIAYQTPRGESAAARALSRHLAVTEEGINVFILNDDTVTTTRPDDATTIRRTLWGAHDEPVDAEERALLVGAGYGGNLS